MVEFFYSSGPNEFGPLTAPQLKKLADAGRLAAGDEVRKGRSGKWVAAAAVHGLFDRPVRQPELAINEMDVVADMPPEDLAAPWNIAPEAERETAVDPRIMEDSGNAAQSAESRLFPDARSNEPHGALLVSWATAVGVACYLASAAGLVLGILSFIGSENIMQETFGAVCFLIAIAGAAGGCSINLLLSLRQPKA